jgi:hypothetical protein
MPGVELDSVASIDDVLANRIRPGKRVVVVDDLGDWRGGGTAWYLAERGHEVVIVTSYPMVGHTIQRTSGDWKLRSRLAELGVTWHTESVVTAWTGTAAEVRGFITRTDLVVEADTLVLATINTPERDVIDGLAALDVPVRAVGDAVAARLAVHAIYEGRVAGQAL